MLLESALIFLFNRKFILGDTDQKKENIATSKFKIKALIKE